MSSKYILLEQLGDGGRLGCVYRAMLGDAAPFFSRDVAIKIMRVHAGALEGSVLLKQVRALAEVDHPSVVQLLDAYAVDMQPSGGSGRGSSTSSSAPQTQELHLVTELCKGGSLGCLPGPPSPPIMREITRQVLLGLAAIHTRVPPLLHYNIKPENICLLRPFTGFIVDVAVKLVDFGLGHLRQPSHGMLTDAAADAKTGGDPFRSPERGCDSAESTDYDLPDDIWAAGITLLLVGVGQASQDSIVAETKSCCAFSSPDYASRLQHHLTQFETAHGTRLAAVIRAMLHTTAAKRLDAQSALYLLEDELPELRDQLCKARAELAQCRAVEPVPSTATCSGKQ